MTHKSTRSDAENSGSRYSSPSLRRFMLLPSRFISFSQLGKELCTYKIFFFLLFSSFGTTLPFFPRYYQQIGFSNGERLSLSTMRPLVQGITAPLWGLIVDVTWLSKKRLIQCCLLAWLIIVTSMAFIEPTEQVCEFRVSNITHSLFVNRTKVKAGFFKRSLENHILYKDVAGSQQHKQGLGGKQEVSGFSFKREHKISKDSQSHLPLYTTNIEELNIANTFRNQTASEHVQSLSSSNSGIRKMKFRHSIRENDSLYINNSLKKRLIGVAKNPQKLTKGVINQINVIAPQYEHYARDHERYSRERREILPNRNKTLSHNKRLKNRKHFKFQRHVNTGEKFNITSKNTLPDDSTALSKIFNQAVWLVIVSEVLLTPVLVHTESSLLQCLGEKKTSFGHTRFFSSCGFTILFISVSALLSHSVRRVCSQMYADFVICFCIFFVCTAATLTATTQLHLPMQHPSKNIVEKIKTQLHNSHFFTLTAAVVFLGYVHAMLRQVSLHGRVNCLSTFEDDVNLQIARGISEVLGFCLSGCIINLLGQMNVIFTCVVICNLNIFFSSFLRGTCRVVLVTIIDSGLHGVAWSVLCIYFSHIGPRDSSGSMQGLLQCFYWGLGTGLGTLVSEPLYKVLGIANMLRISAIIGALVCILFTLGLRSLKWHDRGYYTYLFYCWRDGDNSGPNEGECENLLNTGKKTAEDTDDSGEDSGIESLEHDFEKITNEVAEQEAKKGLKKLTYARYSPPPKNTKNTITISPERIQKVRNEHLFETGNGQRVKKQRVCIEQRSRSVPSSPMSPMFDNEGKAAITGAMSQYFVFKHTDRHLKGKNKLSPSIPAFNQMVLHRPKMADVPPTIDGKVQEYDE